MSETLSAARSWEEIISEWITLTEQSNDILWRKVNILLELVASYGKNSLTAFAKDVHEKESTLTNYFRTAKAFPPDTRILDLPFEVHLQASYADKYKNGQFEGDTRFNVLQLAAEKGLSGNRVRSVIRKERERKKLQTQHILCNWCTIASEIETFEFVLYSPETKAEGARYYFHLVCFNQVKLVIETHGQRSPSTNDSNTSVSQ